MTSKAPFDFQQRVGILFLVEAASLSAAAVTILLGYIAVKAWQSARANGRSHRSGGSSDHDSTHIHNYFLSLMLAELLQAIGGLLNIKWVADAAVSVGTLCTTQGVFKQMGDVGVALSSLAIGLHTFGVLVLRWRTPYITSIIVLSLIWIFVALLVGLGVATHKGQQYYGDTSYWCWISSRFEHQQIALDYLWLWVAAFTNILIYVFMALVLRGKIGNRKDRNQKSAEANVIANQLLFYPLVYTLSVFPISVARWLAFSGKSVPFAATVTCDMFFALSGLFNVILFSLTRPKVLTNDDSTRPSSANIPLDPKSRERSDAGRLPDMNDEPDAYNMTGQLPNLQKTSGYRDDVAYSPNDVENRLRGLGEEER